MTEVPVNQKEYLKKYLAIGKAPGEKKKKKKKPIGNRVQIIDDDADISSQSNIINTDPIIIDEDAPQIVAIIDERPPSMRIDEKTKNPLWQPIGSAENSNNSGEQKQMITGFKIAPKSNDKPFVFADRSPPRRKKRNSSPPRKSRRDNTPPTDIVIKEERKSVSPPKNTYNDDNSPHRKIERSASSQSQIDDNSPPRKKRWDSDSSPPRKNRETTRTQSRWQPKEEDTSPPRRNRHAEDSSPPRRNISRDLSPRRNRHADDSTLKKKRYENNSPPRKYRHLKDTFPPRRSRSMNDHRRIKHGNDGSPPRRNKYTNHVSPSTRKRETTVGRTLDNSPPRKYKKDDRNNPEERKTATSSSDETRPKKMEKTLDGKSAGLQNARELVEETRNFKTREETLFKGLSKDVSGENAETVHRERRTGKIRNLEEEEERQRQKREEEEKNKEKYAKWGRGLAQVENREQQIKEQLHEMSKPLARYADDEDLEKYLKEQEREGDPMLAYIRKKKKKKAADRGEVEKPLFQGEFMPNRYGIRPGHRWDGVDRSNGYEKKWFEVQNEKKAMLEESYKWSTEDM